MYGTCPGCGRPFLQAGVRVHGCGDSRCAWRVCDNCGLVWAVNRHGTYGGARWFDVEDDVSWLFEEWRAKT
jgi:hypothetical protein